MPKKRNIKRKLDLKLLGALGLLVFLSLLVFNKYYFITAIDSSLNGSEVSEKTQNKLPADIKREIENQKKLYSLTTLPTYKVPILMYHYVEFVADKNDKTRISLDIYPTTLDSEINTLKQAGYTFMTAGELADSLNGKTALPKKPIVLTFDDGYRDFYTDAYPILKKYHAKATQYVISGFLDQPNHLLTSQLKEIAKDGLVEIGAHTVSHMWLQGQSLSDVTYQVTQSKKTLEELTGKKVVSFAYPFGAFDKPAAEAVEKAGYTNSVSTVPGIQQSFFHRYFLYRLRPGGREGETLLSWLNDSLLAKF